MTAALLQSAPTRALDDALSFCSAWHARLCPRQVLGVRAGLAALEALGLARGARALLAIVETDGCFVTGVEAATGCTPGLRSLRVEDYGKVAATFVDLRDGRALRVVPRGGVRELAREYAPGEGRRYYAQLAGYRVMPREVLLETTPVRLTAPLTDLTGQRGVRATCARCGEEVIDGREVLIDGQPACRACGGEAYYHR